MTLLLMPGLALLAAQSCLTASVPASIVDHVLLHMLREQPAANKMQSSDDMQPSLLLSDVYLVVSPAALSDAG